MIQIEKEPFEVVKYYGGMYTNDEGKSFEFTIIHTLRENLPNYLELTWLQYPKNYRQLEDKILEQYGE